MNDNPLVLLLPDYDLRTAECLVRLLYTGRYVSYFINLRRPHFCFSCTPQSSAMYLSLLTMLASLGINLSPSSLAVASLEDYNHKKFRVISTVSDSPDVKPMREEWTLLNVDSEQEIMPGSLKIENKFEETNEIQCTEDINVRVQGIEVL